MHDGFDVARRCHVPSQQRINHRRQRRRGCRGRDPQYPVLTTPQYFDKCFIFSLQRNFWFVRHKLVLLFIIQLQSMGRMNLKNNTPRMHHIIPFWDENFINFQRRGTAPPQTHPSPPTAPRFSRLRRSTCQPTPPECSSGVDAHGINSLILLAGYTDVWWTVRDTADDELFSN